MLPYSFLKLIGLWNGRSERTGEDVEMMEEGVGSKRKIIVGASELNFKRDKMEIQPLFSELGVSKY